MESLAPTPPCAAWYECLFLAGQKLFLFAASWPSQEGVMTVPLPHPYLFNASDSIWTILCTGTHLHTDLGPQQAGCELSALGGHPPTLCRAGAEISNAQDTLGNLLSWCQKHFRALRRFLQRLCGPPLIFFLYDNNYAPKTNSELLPA